MQELRYSKIVVCIKECLSGKFAFSVSVITSDVPRRIRPVGIFSNVVWNIGNDKLRFWYSVCFVILKVVEIVLCLSLLHLLIFTKHHIASNIVKKKYGIVRVRYFGRSMIYWVKVFPIIIDYENIPIV